MASGAKAGRDRGGGQRGGRWSLGAENSSPGSTANKNLNLNSANNQKQAEVRSFLTEFLDKNISCQHFDFTILRF